jgi:large subunit ribosomal protein L35
MPKLKSNKAAKKRFKITKGLKILRRRAGGRHLLSSKSGKRRRSIMRGTGVHDADHAKILKMFPYA